MREEGGSGEEGMGNNNGEGVGSKWVEIMKR